MTLDHDQFSADVIKEIGIFTQKILITLNSGGIIALLTFLGSAASNPGIILDVDVLKSSAVLFVLGLAFVGVSIFITYLNAQKNLARANQPDDRFTRFMLLMTGPPILSFIAFLSAIMVAFSAVSSA